MATRNSPARDIVITRVFDAPRELVWKAWTDPESFKKWYGPKGVTTTSAKIDLRVGGKRLICMRSREGPEFWYTGTYREVVPMERLVYTDSLADAQGNVVPATHYGMPAEWPSETLVTVTFQDQGRKTKMILRHGGMPAGPMSDGAAAGWNGSFDKLAEHLTTLGKER